ncbi:MAG: flagellar hook-associated protein FlgL [Syntrophomonadaceae bacterium]|nr:flagellar hook-associated protein FlgL [Syntrophomonadaceae bacterium]
MRITNFMLVNDLRRNLNSNLERMDEFQRQLSTGRKINKPSDDPAGIVKSLRLRTSLVEGEQYLSNIKEAANYMQTTDSSLNDINEVMQKIRELTNKAATGTNDPDSNRAIAREVAELNNQLMMIANSTYGSKYIFSGTNVTEAPYQDGKWIGNNDYLNMEIGAGVKIPTNLMMREYFMGRLSETYIDPNASFINKVEADKLREGAYQIKTAAGLASEAGSDLQSPNNKGMFFFTNAANPMNAPINAGDAVGATNSLYNGTLNIKVTNVDAANNTLTVDVSGKLAIGGGQFQEVQFNGLTMNMDAANNGAILTIPSDPAAKTGLAAIIPGAQPLVIWNNSGFDLGGIDDTNPQFTMGDKVSISLNSSQAVAREQQSYLGSVPNNGCFFYESINTPATLAVGKDATALNNDSSYNGSLLLEVKRVTPASGNIGPRFIALSENGADKIFTLNKPLYQKDKNGVLQAVSDNTDLTSSFTYTGTGSLDSAIYNYDETTGIATITFTATPGTPPADPKASIMWNNDWDADANGGLGGTVPESGKNKVYDQYGNEYIPVAATFDGTSWSYKDNYESAKILVDIKGHIYTSDGKYKYVELENKEIDMETARNQQIFKISASDIGDPDFTEDLIIWNNGSDTLGGISLATPEIAVGDKTIISLSTGGKADSRSVDIGYTFTDIKGIQTGSGGHNFVFDNATMDNKVNQFKFFTLDKETGLYYDGSISLETATVESSPEGAVRFKYQAGLFGYVADLTRRIEVGKLPQVGNEMAGNDERMQELLFYRSTIGARINRLELQQNRLEYTQESYIGLLADNESANEAETILNLKLQENVYRSSLAAGARIIMPTLVDFLR